MEKAVHTIVLDAGPIINNDPGVSSLIAQAEELVTTPDIISEIKDESTRARIASTLIPFLQLRNPRPDSLNFAKEFARRTGDLPVLSVPDIRLIALTYELECERNGGDWRLKKVPGQKRTNGPSPGTIKSQNERDDLVSTSHFEDRQVMQAKKAKQETDRIPVQTLDRTPEPEASKDDVSCDQITDSVNGNTNNCIENLGSDNYEKGLNNYTASVDIITSTNERSITEQLARLEVEEGKQEIPNITPQTLQSPQRDSDDDLNEWITPSNLKKWQENSNVTISSSTEQKTPLQVAAITTDYAIQNVLLQINLNLLSPSLQRVKYIKTFVLRCHACFNVTKEMNKQFCPRCGLPSLTRVSCSTMQRGGFKLHLKKNMQWNTRGDRYSIPKPISGSANGRTNNGGKGKGGGKGGWGQGLMLAEDQKEYIRAVQQSSRKERNLMDDDFLPSILSGERSRPGGRPKIGAGRNVNSRRRY